MGLQAVKLADNGRKPAQQPASKAARRWNTQVWAFGGAISGYAVLRYNAFGTVPWSDVPFYVANKALSVTATFCFCAALLARSSEGSDPSAQRRHFRGLGIKLSWLHIAASAVLLNQTYFPKAFDESARLTLLWGVSMLAGLVILAMPWPRVGKFAPWLATGVVGGVVTHLAAMAWQNWITPAAWPGYMPPITLLTTLGLCYTLFKYLSRRDRT